MQSGEEMVGVSVMATPCELLMGRLNARDALIGFAMQILWLAVGIVVLRIAWKAGVKRYGAVGA